MASLIVCLGGASCVWDDLDAARKILEVNGIPYDIGACNEAGADYPGILSLWASLHAEKFDKWQQERKKNGYPDTIKTASIKKCGQTRIDLVTKEIWHGSSGLYMCKVSLIDSGYTHAIVCGVPMNIDPHYFSEKKWNDAPKYRKSWIEARDSQELSGRIRSMSGWTKELLGYPDTRWLQQVAAS